MFCLSCGSKLAKPASRCPACSSFYIFTTPDVIPAENPKLREKLLRFYLACATSQELSEWLQDIGQDPKGTAEEKRARVRQHTKYLSMTPETFPLQTIHYLSSYTGDHLYDLCQDLGLDGDGSKNTLFRRTYREVGCREGWLYPISKAAPVISKQTVLPFVQWYPVLKNYEYEKDYYKDFHEEMSEVFGLHNVPDQLAIAYGNTLKIDFHIGHPQQGGVGIEFKMPINNSELQRALGQMDQYVSRYQAELIIVIIPDFLSPAQVELFLGELGRKNITAVVKTKVS